MTTDRVVLNVLIEHIDIEHIDVLHVGLLEPRWTDASLPHHRLPMIKRAPKGIPKRLHGVPPEVHAKGPQRLTQEHPNPLNHPHGSPNQFNPLAGAQSDAITTLIYIYIYTHDE